MLTEIKFSQGRGRHTGTPPKKAKPRQEFNVEKELALALKGHFWTASKKRSFNYIISNAKSRERAKIKRRISEQLAEHLVDPQKSKTWKTLFKQGDLKPYSMFLNALFVPHMKAELSKVLELVVFSSTAGSHDTRKAIEIAMKSYPKAIGWNEPEAIKRMKEAVVVIEAFDKDTANEEQISAFERALETIVYSEIKTSENIITVKVYSKMHDLKIKYKGTLLSQLVFAANDKINYLI